jgi:hypothetical protein
MVYNVVRPADIPALNLSRRPIKSTDRFYIEKHQEDSSFDYLNITLSLVILAKKYSFYDLKFLVLKTPTL